MDTKKSGTTINRLIAGLPANDRRRLVAGCQLVELECSGMLVGPAERLAHVYFPIESFLSLTLPVDGRENMEISLVGNEGMVGLPLVLGIRFLGFSAVVQGPGLALRMSAKAFLGELEGGSALQVRLKRYLFVVMCQMAQSATCHRYHFVEECLARWLLMSRDRAHRDSFDVTHEFLSFMLGVRRVGITNAAGALQKRKLITYTRGELTILDHHGLQSAACPCYELDKATYKRIMDRRLSPNSGTGADGIKEAKGSG